MGAIIMASIAAIFFVAALFTWLTKTYGLDIAFLGVAVLLSIAAMSLILKARRTQKANQTILREQQDRLRDLLDGQADPLADHIPEDVLMHPLSQKILLQIEDHPLPAGLSAVGLGLILSHQIFDGD